MCNLQRVEVHSTTVHEGQESVQRYSFTLSLTPVLDVGGWSKLRPGRFTPGNNRGPIVQEVTWFWDGEENIVPPPGFETRNVQHVASRYTDSAIPAQQPQNR